MNNDEFEYYVLIGIISGLIVSFSSMIANTFDEDWQKMLMISIVSLSLFIVVKFTMRFTTKRDHKKERKHVAHKQHPF